VDAALGHAQLGERLGHSVPELGPLLPLGEVEIGHLLAQSLQQGRVEVVVIVLDDRLLVLGEFRHGPWGSAVLVPASGSVSRKNGGKAAGRTSCRQIQYRKLDPSQARDFDAHDHV
ncbi:MAG: hypothetical protein ACK56I_32965, partial [bacterium]